MPQSAAMARPFSCYHGYPQTHMARHVMPRIAPLGGRCDGTADTQRPILSGHFLLEEAPDAVLAAFLHFLD